MAGRGCQPSLATRVNSRKNLPFWRLCVRVGPWPWLVLLGPASATVQDNVCFKAFPVICLPQFCHAVICWRAFRKPLMCGYGKELLWTAVFPLQWLLSPSPGRHPCTCSALQVVWIDIFYFFCNFTCCQTLIESRIVSASTRNHTNLNQQPHSWTSHLKPLDIGGVAHALWKVCVCHAI